MENQQQVSKPNWIDEEKKLGECGALFNKAMRTDIAYQVIFLDEGFSFEQEYDGKKRDKVAFKIRVTGGGIVGEEYTWYITKSKRRDSLYGMLASLFVKQNHGKALGYMVDVVATGKDKDRRYQIKQFSDLVFAQNKKEAGQ